ncbi:MAG: hypothetical protein A2X12_02015 [Bacteroidetes bacterium GWE2_29_8]|nr:MAG: hypothetical protein A2X12_02015 [Bacteroidetes bacterium GWE2_29_8]
MSLKSLISQHFANYVIKKIYKKYQHPESEQKKVFENIINTAKNTNFGIEHNFSKINNYDDFVNNVPIRDYEQLSQYIEQIKLGKKDVLWKGKPIYLAKTSGTTSGNKYIPITKESISNHINSARNAILAYIEETKKTDFINGKMIFLQGSPILDEISGIKTGRLSGIVVHHVPLYLQKNRMPSYKTNCIEDWEEKVDKIAKETLDKNMTLISGIPPWVQMYFDKLTLKTEKKISQIFPNFSLFIYGGVNYEPYRQKLESSIGKKIDSIELYPASEGFFAYQNSQKDNGLLLIIDSGIFYEFIKAEDVFKPNAKRLPLWDVEIGVNYALVINSNAGLWGYLIGDTIKFISNNPYKIRVTGRIKHFISAFGEHVIAEEVESALKYALENIKAEISEFTVSPMVNPPNKELPYHEWLIEFEKEPKDMSSFQILIDNKLRELNSYYDDLITGKILQPIKIKSLPKDCFINYMKSKGKLGGQNKLPRLSNDRIIAEEISNFCLR